MLRQSQRTRLLEEHPDEVIDGIVNGFRFGQDDHGHQGAYFAWLAAREKTNLVQFWGSDEIFENQHVRARLLFNLNRFHRGSKPLAGINLGGLSEHDESRFHGALDAALYYARLWIAQHSDTLEQIKSEADLRQALQNGTIEMDHPGKPFLAVPDKFL